jgi:hypothetical protein
MSLSKKLYLLTMITATISTFSFCFEKEESSLLEAQKQSPLLVTYAQQINDSYDTISEKCKRFYNPVGLSAISFASAALGTKRLIFLVAGGIIAMHSEIIMEQIQQNLKDNANQDNEKNLNLQNQIVPGTSK